MAIPAVTTAALLSAPLVVLLFLFGHMATSAAPTDLHLEGCKLFKDSQKLQTINCTSFNPILTVASSLFSDFSHIDVLNVKDVSDGSGEHIIDGLFGVFSNVRYMNLINASITKVYPNAFKGLKRLEELDLTKNKIRQFHAETFYDTPNLNFLDLSFNPVRLALSTFLTSKSLQTLYLSNCNLTILPANSFRGVPYLKSLDLSGNQIQSFTYRSFPRSLVHLDLTKNNLTNILTKPITSLNKLTSLDISDNPINCTCSLIGLQDWFSSRGIVFENDVICASPLEYQGKRLKDISENEICLDEKDKTEETSDSSCDDEMCNTTKNEARYIYNAFQADQPANGEVTGDITTNTEKTDAITSMKAKDTEIKDENNQIENLTDNKSEDVDQIINATNDLNDDTSFSSFTENSLNIEPTSNEKIISSEITTVEPLKSKNLDETIASVGTIESLETVDADAPLTEITTVKETSNINSEPTLSPNTFDEKATITAKPEINTDVPITSSPETIPITNELLKAIVDEKTTITPKPETNTDVPITFPTETTPLTTELLNAIVDEKVTTTAKSETSTDVPITSPIETSSMTTDLLKTIVDEEVTTTAKPEINTDVPITSPTETTSMTTELLKAIVDEKATTTLKPETSTDIPITSPTEINPITTTENSDIPIIAVTQSTTTEPQTTESSISSMTLDSIKENFIDKITTVTPTEIITTTEVVITTTSSPTITNFKIVSALPETTTTIASQVPTQANTVPVIVPETTTSAIIVTTEKLNYIPRSEENVDTTTEIPKISEITTETTNKTGIIVLLPSTNNREGKMLPSVENQDSNNSTSTMGSYIVLGGILIMLLLLILYASTRGKRQTENNKRPLDDAEGNMTELQDMTTLLPTTPIANGHKNNKYPNEEPSVTAKLLETEDHADSNGNGYVYPQDSHAVPEKTNSPKKTEETNGKSTLPRTNGTSNGPPPLELTKARVVVLPDSIPRTPIYIQKNVDS